MRDDHVTLGLASMTVPLPFVLQPNDDDLGYLTIDETGRYAMLVYTDDLLVVTGYQRKLDSLVLFGIEAVYVGDFSICWEWDQDGRFVGAKTYEAAPDEPPCACVDCDRRRGLAAEALRRREIEQMNMLLRAASAFGPQPIPEG